MSTIQESLEFCEFDAITLYRNLVEDSIGRSLTDDEWINFTEEVGKRLDDIGWMVVEEVEKQWRGE